MTQVIIISGVVGVLASLITFLILNNLPKQIAKRRALNAYKRALHVELVKQSTEKK